MVGQRGHFDKIRPAPNFHNDRLTGTGLLNKHYIDSSLLRHEPSMCGVKSYLISCFSNEVFQMQLLGVLSSDRVSDNLMCPPNLFFCKDSPSFFRSSKNHLTNFYFPVADCFV